MTIDKLIDALGKVRDRLGNVEVVAEDEFSHYTRGVGDDGDVALIYLSSIYEGDDDEKD